ncbi:Syntaxin-6 [Kappamyces sp. JEL0829]|nr:Syntaxin-6 [Kappamyces sp. JEL0829]
MSDDPFFIVKREVEQSLNQVHQLLSSQKGRGLTTDIQDRLQNIVADLDELDDTIKIVQSNPSRFQLSKKDVDDRKAFISATRRQVADLKSRLQAKPAAGAQEARPQQLPSRAIENEKQQQQLMMQQQDQQVEQVAVTIRNLREIGEVMGNELDDQTRLLGEVDAHVDATSDRMQDGIKRMKDFIQANSDIKQQLTIIGLVVLLVILLVIVISM